jgi:hypothetical protein
MRISDGFVGFAGYRLAFLTGNDQRRLGLGLQRAAKLAIASTTGLHCDVVSIAQGGERSYPEVWKGVREAVENGVIVVAAAAQIPFANIPNTLRLLPAFPARYSASNIPLVAAGAVTPELLPWPPAFRGQAVDLSAPGTNITHVANDSDCGDTRPCLEHDGKGTTYATGLIAGAALLFLERWHGRQGILDHYTAAAGTPIAKAAIPCAFKMSVRRTARRDTPTLADLRKQGFGFGLLDVRALLHEHELPPLELVQQCIDQFHVAAASGTFLPSFSNDLNEWERKSDRDALPEPPAAFGNDAAPDESVLDAAEIDDALRSGCLDPSILCGSAPAQPMVGCLSPELAARFASPHLRGLRERSCSANH